MGRRWGTRTSIGMAIVAIALSAPAWSRGVRIETVVRADRLVGRWAGQVVVLEVAGIWAPSPPGGGRLPEYLGEEARRFVVGALSGGRPPGDRSSGGSTAGAARGVTLELIEARGSRRARVRVRLGPGGDLAVVLAERGLALCDRLSAADAEHGTAICEAERRARRGRRGMHDGGFQAFARRRGGGMIVLGTIGVFESTRGEAAQAAEAEVGDSGGWWTRDDRQPLRHPVEAIRDDGHRTLGLPHDGSNRGH